jgi:hypothetical protein
MSTIKEIDALLKAKYPNIILSRYKNKSEKLAALSGTMQIHQADKPRAPRSSKATTVAANPFALPSAAVPGATMPGMPITIPTAQEAKKGSRKKTSAAALAPVDPKIAAFNNLKADLIPGVANELANATVVYANSTGTQEIGQPFQVTIYRVGNDGAISIRLMEEGKYGSSVIPVGSEHELSLDVSNGYLSNNGVYEFNWIKSIPNVNAAVVIPVSQLMSRTQSQLAGQQNVLAEQKTLIERNLSGVVAPFIAERDISGVKKEQLNEMYQSAQQLMEKIKAFYQNNGEQSSANEFLSSAQKVIKVIGESLGGN